MWGAAIAAIGEAVKSWFEGKTEIKKAKVEREVKALTHESNWDAVQADASRGSWKDEWLTLLVSIPLILAFVPSMSQYVQQGFDVLKEDREFYMEGDDTPLMSAYDLIIRYYSIPSLGD